MNVAKTIYSPTYRKLIGWISAERKFKKIKQSELAQMLGFANSTYISKIEKFDRKLDAYEYVEVCKALKLDPIEGIKILLNE